MQAFPGRSVFSYALLIATRKKPPTPRLQCPQNQRFQVRDQGFEAELIAHSLCALLNNAKAIIYDRSGNCKYFLYFFSPFFYSFFQSAFPAGTAASFFAAMTQICIEDPAHFLHGSVQAEQPSVQPGPAVYECAYTGFPGFAAFHFVLTIRFINGARKAPFCIRIVYASSGNVCSRKRYFLTAISLLMGFPFAENFSSYSVMIFPRFISSL